MLQSQTGPLELPTTRFNIPKRLQCDGEVDANGVSFFFVSTGVSQWSVLEPFLYILYTIAPPKFLK